ncbi:hypothetical protein ACQWYW_001024 [Enterobacter cloacae]
MSNIDKRALREAAENASTDNHTQDEWFHYLRCSTPETVLALLDELEDYKAAYEEESRDKEVQRSVIDDALCKLLPGCHYMDLPDGGSVTPLEQVSRMIADYSEQLQAAEKRIADYQARLERIERRCDHHGSVYWDVSNVKRCAKCGMAIIESANGATS